MRQGYCTMQKFIDHHLKRYIPKHGPHLQKKDSIVEYIRRKQSIW